MSDFGLSIFFGLLFGFLFGLGAALMLVHAAYKKGYRKAVADSLEPVKPKAFKLEFETLRKQRAVSAAAHAAKLGVTYVDKDRPELTSGDE